MSRGPEEANKLTESTYKVSVDMSLVWVNDRCETRYTAAP